MVWISAVLWYTFVQSSRGTGIPAGNKTLKENKNAKKFCWVLTKIDFKNALQYMKKYQDGLSPSFNALPYSAAKLYRKTSVSESLFS